MWAHEESIETTATAEAVWRLWSDVEGWPGWNGDIERTEITGPDADELGPQITGDFAQTLAALRDQAE
jgi:hypothetical protein